MDAPKSIFINLTTMYVVEKGYPNAVEYVLKDNNPVRNWQEEQPHHIPEFNGHADHDFIDTIPTRE
ncbi:MAG: hypothetical protein SPM02_00875 [Bacteroidales bacterium]|nr:hypothetical protein [Bacteroidales bacterium]